MLRKRVVTVLEEDEYVDTLEHIITRDFFPALPYLSGEKVGQTPGPSTVEPSPIVGGSFEDDTPVRKRPSSPSPAPGQIDKTQTDEKKGDKKSMSLNQFLTTHTSEDNKAFADILEQDEVKRKERAAWLYEQEDYEKKLLELKGSDPNRTGMIEMWKYKARNALMYNPTGEGVPQHVSTKNDKGEERIVAANTRFPGGFYEAPNEEEKDALAKGETPGATPQVDGYKLVRSPSPSPEAVGESPLITWGDVVGTPLHLAEEDDVEPLEVEGGPKKKFKPAGFRVPETPSRDEIAHKLSQKASKAIRARQKQQTSSLLRRTGSSSRRSGSRRNRHTPSPLGRSPGLRNTPSPGYPKLSAAAIRLMRGRTKKGLDSQLRASYSPSPNIAAGQSPFLRPGSSSRATPSRRATPSPLTSRKRLRPTPSPLARSRAPI